MDIREQLPEITGTLEAYVVDDAGNEVLVHRFRNTVVAGMYTHLWDLLANDDYLGDASLFALGDDATPTDFDDTGLGNLLYQQATDSAVRTSYRLTVTTTMEKLSGNGNTYYEAGCFVRWIQVGALSGTYRMIARAVFRDPEGAILGIEKNGQRILFRWHFDREGLV